MVGHHGQRHLRHPQGRILDAHTIGDIALAFQEAAVDTLVVKCQRALEQTGHNKTKAAELLGISFRQLRYRVKKLGIE